MAGMPKQTKFRFKFVLPDVRYISDGCCCVHRNSKIFKVTVRGPAIRGRVPLCTVVAASERVEPLPVAFDQPRLPMEMLTAHVIRHAEDVRSVRAWLLVNKTMRDVVRARFSRNDFLNLPEWTPFDSTVSVAKLATVMSLPDAFYKEFLPRQHVVFVSALIEAGSGGWILRDARFPAVGYHVVGSAAVLRVVTGAIESRRTPILLTRGCYKILALALIRPREVSWWDYKTVDKRDNFSIKTIADEFRSRMLGKCAYSECPIANASFDKPESFLHKTPVVLAAELDSLRLICTYEQ